MTTCGGNIRPFPLGPTLQRTRLLSYVILVNFLLAIRAPFAVVELAFFSRFFSAEGCLPCIVGWMSYSVTRPIPSLRTGRVSLPIIQ